jgi:hypothetical protein
MAEEGPKRIHPAKPVIVTFLVATILAAILYRIEALLDNDGPLANFLKTLWAFMRGDATFAEVLAATGSPFLASMVFFLRIFSLLLSIIIIWAIIVTARKYSEANAKLKAGIHPPKEIVYGVESTPSDYVNPKWAKVLEHINSPNESDWKLAILEADIMLNDMLDKIGYQGATMSDKLKSVEPSDFDTLQDAWEAHKIRNAIAHEGSDYVVNKPEAERVIRLFKKVFDEFKYI